MDLRDAPHNRKPEPAAALAGAQDTVEALAESCPLVGRNAGSFIGDYDRRAFAAGTDFNVHAPSVGAIAHRVVDEVAQEHSQQFPVSLDADRLRQARLS